MLDQIEALLKACIGLDPASIGTAAIERAVQQRCAARALPDLHAYWQCVQSSEEELRQLIEAVVVSETWFFRHEEAFPLLVGLMRGVCLRSMPVGVVRLLSVPCSTGEEPYSMAMALLDGGIPPERFRIDAIDISDRALALAREGVYGRNAFRGAGLACRDRYFERLPGAWRLSEAPRRPVRFRRDNLFASDFLTGDERYDAIFCRNVLIYFDRETQDRAIGILARLLKPGGTLFVAPAEASLPPAHGFAVAGETTGFAFQRQARRPPAQRPVVATVVGHAPSPRLATAAPRERRALGIPPAAAPASAAAAAMADPAEALRLADQGHFAEAANCCS